MERERHTFCDPGPAIDCPDWRPPMCRRTKTRQPHPRKLSPGKAETIRLIYATGFVTMAWLGTWYGVSAVAIWNVVNGYSYGSNCYVDE